MSSAQPSAQDRTPTKATSLAESDRSGGEEWKLARRTPAAGQALRVALTIKEPWEEDVDEGLCDTKANYFDSQSGQSSPGRP